MKSEASLSKIGKFQVTSMGYWGCGLFTQLKVWSRTVAQRRVWRERSAGTWEERPAQRSNATTATAWNGIAPWHDPLAFWPTDRPPPASSRRPLRCRRCRCSPRSVGRSVGLPRLPPIKPVMNSRQTQISQVERERASEREAERRGKSGGGEGGRGEIGRMMGGVREGACGLDTRTSINVHARRCGRHMPVSGIWLILDLLCTKS